MFDDVGEVEGDNTFDIVGNDGDEEDEEVAAVHAKDENADENVEVVTMAPHPQSLPAFIGGGVRVPIAHSPTFVIYGVRASSAVSSLASRGGGG